MQNRKLPVGINTHTARLRETETETEMDKEQRDRVAILTDLRELLLLNNNARRAVADDDYIYLLSGTLAKRGRERYIR